MKHEEQIGRSDGRPTRSHTVTSATAARRTSAGAAAHRSGHVVDRALAVHALLASGKSAADVQHRLGKSKGYVSVLGYLGQALAGLAPEDLAPYRAAGLTPRVVWPLATRARTEERTALKQAFGDAVTEAARDAARRRARDRATVQLRAALREHAQAAAAGLAAPPNARGGRRPRPSSSPLGVLAWDPAAWAADPVAYARAHLAALAAAHRAVVDHATRAVRQAGAEQALAAHVAVAGEASLRQLAARTDPARWRALALEAHAARTPAEVQALALLAGPTRALYTLASSPAAHADAHARSWTDTHRDPYADVDADLAD